jgi:hypothetical protein
VPLQEQEWQRAWVLDISLTGVGLLLSRQLDPGLPVVVHLKSAAANKAFELSAIVCHASPQPDGDWVVGCKLNDKLTDEQLDALL